MEGLLRDQFRAYRATLRDDHRPAATGTMGSGWCTGSG
jgi:hypothetical protein